MKYRYNVYELVRNGYCLFITTKATLASILVFRNLLEHILHKNLKRAKERRVPVGLQHILLNFLHVQALEKTYLQLHLSFAPLVHKAKRLQTLVFENWKENIPLPPNHDR